MEFKEANNLQFDLEEMIKRLVKTRNFDRGVL